MWESSDHGKERMPSDRKLNTLKTPRGGGPSLHPHRCCTTSADNHGMSHQKCAFVRVRVYVCALVSTWYVRVSFVSLCEHACVFPSVCLLYVCVSLCARLCGLEIVFNHWLCLTLSLGLTGDGMFACSSTLCLLTSAFFPIHVDMLCWSIMRLFL